MGRFAQGQRRERRERGSLSTAPMSRRPGPGRLSSRRDGEREVPRAGQATTPIGWRNVKSGSTGHREGLAAELGDRAGIELEDARARPASSRASAMRTPICKVSSCAGRRSPARRARRRRGVAAFARTQVAPAGLPGALGRLDGAVHVRERGGGDRGEGFLGGRMMRVVRWPEAPSRKTSCGRQRGDGHRTCR